MRHKWLPEVKDQPKTRIKKWACQCGMTREKRLEKFYYFGTDGVLASMEPPPCRRAEHVATTAASRDASLVHGISVDLFADGTRASATVKLAGSVPTRYATVHVYPVLAEDSVYRVSAVSRNYSNNIATVRTRKDSTTIEWMPHECDVPHEVLSQVLQMICTTMNNNRNNA